MTIYGAVHGALMQMRTGMSVPISGVNATSQITLKRMVMRHIPSMQEK